MAVETWGVDSTFFQSFHPQISVSSSGPLTEARLTTIIKAAAGEVNQIIEGIFGDGAVASFASDTTTNTYQVIAKLVLKVAEPDLLAAAHNRTAVLETVQQALDFARQRIQDLKANPSEIDTTDDTRGGSVATSTDYLGLNTSEASRANRRNFDSAIDRTSLADDENIW